MKKIFVFFLIFILFLYTNALVISNKDKKIEDNEIRGIYISYIEYLSYFQRNTISINKAHINKMLDNIKSLNFNTVFLHVSPFSDSIYNSKIFPYSYTLTGIEGKNPGMDYLDYFIRAAKKRKISIHAWINPYRISSTNNIDNLSKTNPAYSLLNTNAVKVSENGIYYNPSNPKVIELIIKQVYELISNYDIAGIHFDDYFYPDNDIDKENYKQFFEKNPNITLTDYRFMVINSMIKIVYKTIKDYDKNLIFSIAPDGNINNNYNIHFADVKNWLQEDGYIDIIMPQVYYGFNHDTKPFKETIDEWNSLIKNNTKIVPILAFYKVGVEDKLAGNAKLEWIENDDIIKRQIDYSKTLNNYHGIGLFRYDFLFNETLKNAKTEKELNNIKNVFKK